MFDCVSVRQLTDYIIAVVSLKDRREGERGAEWMLVEKFTVCFHEHCHIQEFLNKAWWHTLCQPSEMEASLGSVY